MDHAREVELIQAIDHDVQRLLERSEALMRAGEDRPLLTLMGRRLRAHLRGVAELSGSLAALVSPEAARDDAGQAERRTGPSFGPGEHATKPSRRSRASAALAGSSDHPGLAGTAVRREDAPVVRLRSRMPRGAWRRRGLGELARATDPTVDADPASAGDAKESSETASAREPVYRLRKAGTAEAAHGTASPAEHRNALERLQDFFSGPGREPPAPAAADRD